MIPLEKKNKFFLFEVLFSSKLGFEIFSSINEIDFFLIRYKLLLNKLKIS